MLTGQNGILTQAQRAKNETEEAQKEEQNILDSYENYLNDVTGDVSQVDDSNPGVLEGSGTQQEPFIINSIEDLVVFADNVTKGSNTYQDQYVELGLSLDFNSDKSYVNPNSEDYAQYGYNGKLKEVLNSNGFIPIGGNLLPVDEAAKYCFYGNFNGNGFSIYNLKILSENVPEENTGAFGFFTRNSGRIINLGLCNAINNMKFSGESWFITGLLIGSNLDSGIVENCYTTGNINISENTIGSNIGGLVGINRGTIKNCYNKANIIVEGFSESARIGGVVGANEGNIKNIYNNGNINVKITEEDTNKVATPHVIGEAIGRDFGSMENVYNIGEINVENNQDEENTGVLIGGVVPATNLEEKSDTWYYLEDIIISKGIKIEISDIGEAKSSSEMKSQEFLNSLNQDNSGMWKFVSGKNNGYPVLYWE